MSFDLTDAFGPENVASIAAAYEAALLAGGEVASEREVRFALISGLIGEARRGNFDPDRLKKTALSILERIVHSRSAAIDARV